MLTYILSGKNVEKQKSFFFKYTEDDLLHAVTIFEETLWKLGRRNAITASHIALWKKIKGAYAYMLWEMGPATKLPKVEEDLLETFVIATADR